MEEDNESGSFATCRRLGKPSWLFAQLTKSPENKSAGVAQPGNGPEKRSLQFTQLAMGQENDAAGVAQLASSLQKTIKSGWPLLICSEREGGD